MVVPFPFSGKQEYKRHPAVVLASWHFGNSSDYLLCVISAQSASDPYIMDVSNADLQERAGTGFHKKCFVRPAYLFAADEGLIAYKMGSLKADKMRAVMTTIRTVLNGEEETAPESLQEPEDEEL